MPAGMPTRSSLEAASPAITSTGTVVRSITWLVTESSTNRTSELLRAVLRLDAPADGVVSAFFRQHRGLGPRERRGDVGARAPLSHGRLDLRQQRRDAAGL